MGNINHIEHQHTILSNIPSKLDQNLKNCLPITFQDVKYKPTNPRLIVAIDPCSCTNFLAFVIELILCLLSLFFKKYLFVKLFDEEIR